MQPKQENWYKVIDETKVSTPGLLVFPDRVRNNITSMIAIAGDVNRLWPHIKTHKMAAVVQLQMEHGIRRFKCATLGEVQLLVDCGVDHILLAMQPDRDKLLKILKLQQNHPEISFSVLVDNATSLKVFSELAEQKLQNLNLWLDLNIGMNRTGIIPGSEAVKLYREIENHPWLTAKGLHAYDGHIRPHKLDERIAKCDVGFQAVFELKRTIESAGGKVADIIAGGSPTFFPHSLRGDVFLSPGTTLLWDAGYSKIWEESPFLIAAVLATRIISKPAKNILCFDLGHKAMAPEMPLPRAIIFGLETAVHKGQSEEHLIIETPLADQYQVGDMAYALPYHICPTVAKHNKAQIVSEGQLSEYWEVKARDYIVNI